MTRFATFKYLSTTSLHLAVLQFPHNAAVTPPVLPVDMYIQPFFQLYVTQEYDIIDDVINEVVQCANELLIRLLFCQGFVLQNVGILP